MTIDPETKKYIDALMLEHVVKVSSFLSAFCNHLEDGGILKRGEFDAIMADAQKMADLSLKIGAAKVAALSRDPDALKQFKAALHELSKERNWDDLK